MVRATLDAFADEMEKIAVAKWRTAYRQAKKTFGSEGFTTKAGTEAQMLLARFNKKGLSTGFPSGAGKPPSLRMEQGPNPRSRLTGGEALRKRLATKQDLARWAEKAKAAPLAEAA